MERDEEDNKKEYIRLSKASIDNYIYNRDYRKAFNHIIFVLERLDAQEKVELIDYYSKKLIPTP